MPEALPEMLTSGARVKANDYDKDGDLDLFIGGRLIPSNYPMAPRSYLLKNEGGHFVDATLEFAAELESPGLVTDFVWTDFDGDRQTDLVVAGEWMTISFFKNDNGHLKKTSPTLSHADNRPVDLAGWWFSLAADDLDGDGDIDFVAGNLGLNNKFHAAPDHPLEIYLNDFDDSGTNDIVLAKTDHDQVYPLRGKDCSTQQMPFIKDKFPTYDGFAKAVLTEVYDTAKLEEAVHYSVTDFSSVWLENRGTEGFVVHDLPIEAQFAPINDILIRDLNKDGHLDLVVAGNMFSPEIETAAYDAGTGLLLLGNGKGQFEPVLSRHSGLYLPDDLRDLAWIRVKGDLVLLGANNFEALRVFRVD